MIYDIQRMDFVPNMIDVFNITLISYIISQIEISISFKNCTSFQNIIY